MTVLSARRLTGVPLPQSPPSGAAASPGPILVVDDEARDRRMVAWILGDAGYETVEAADAEEAQAYLAAHTVAAMVLDVRLGGGMSGLGLVRHLREQPATATLPVLLVTADDAVRTRVEGLGAGATDFVAKPFEPDELVARLEAHLRSQAAWLVVLDAELRRRASVASALVAAAGDGPPNATAEAICEGLGTLGHLSGAAIVRIDRSVGASIIAERGDETWRAALTRLLDTPVGLAAGPRVQRIGIDLVVAPIRMNGGPVGILVLGAAPGTPTGTDRLLAEAIDLAAVLGGLLAPVLSDVVERERRRANLERVIRAEAFRPVFQPLVDLHLGEVVGYEALTRFDDGTLPEPRFAEASELGLGPDLEQATMAAALRAARRLPDGPFVSLNVSPDLIVNHADLLARELAAGDRSLVIELTEHDVVEDYVTLRSAIARLDPPVRVSVDDAGAGFASLRHILMLSPDFVKLDRTWVQGIDRDPSRQALVAGLVRFADQTSCQLVAEGIEQEPEKATLQELDVALGQGFLLGAPTPVR
jgi:EAL domain-containing protein (putative c-di-GMP-specific phosphodiesterase class I)/CheY-like chemotaxis protein